MRTIILAILAISISFASAQKQKPEQNTDPKVAEELFRNLHYAQALNQYTLLLEKDSNNVVYKQRLAVCYLNTNVDKRLALPLLEYVAYDPYCDPQAWYDLGRAYQFSYRFKDAIKAFKRYGSFKKSGESNPISFERQIEYCENAIELMKKTVPVLFENMGENINSQYPDFNPFVTGDEKNLLFSTKRPANASAPLDYDGYPYAVVFESKPKNGIWTKAKKLPAPINTDFADEITWLSGDGTRLVLYLVNISNLEVENDLYLVRKKNNIYLPPESFGPNINSPETIESAGCLTPDGNTIFFASDKQGGFGSGDLYFSVKTKDGWSKPTNLGSNVNTPYDEDNPYLGPDGKTLFFSSLGHKSMGGYDLFKTTWNSKNNTFTPAENIGFPINNPENNYTISFGRSMKHAYISALREGGLGNLDIYKVTFLNKP